MENNIPGIFNYCDRWCERCRMTDRCANYDSTDYREYTMDKALEKVSESFKETLSLLYKWAEENDIDLEELVNNPDPELEKKEKENHDMARDNKNARLSMDYANKTATFLEQNEQLFADYALSCQKQLEMGIEDAKTNFYNVEEAIEIIQWYMYQIHVKLRRAYHGVLEFDNEYEEPIQNDYNGSAKVALLGVEKSISAWEVLLKIIPENNEIWGQLAVLDRIRKNLLVDFPNVHKFIRPGFDD
jgi:hypothetical protein